jgi:uncharacterized Rossmann fold enzyme
MNFAEWEPIYRAILDDFGFDRSADERARDDLAVAAEPFDESRLDCRGLTVAVVGAAPSLAENLAAAEAADRVFAASTAADVCLAGDVDVDCMVTDLDKNPETGAELSAAGVPVAVHAHGDNRPALDTWLPRYEMSNVLATTQAAPRGAVVNHGGFTDGDRAAFLADAAGAERLVFAGWDFDDPSVAPVKLKKLRWAERLLFVLERRRDETFSVLDGRRDALDPEPYGTT